jgi:hypothetical protein
MAALLAFTALAGSFAAADPKPAAPADLSGSQQQVYRDYERFEKALFDVAEQARRKDPERAELLYRARSASQEQNVLAEMQTIAELLRTRDAKGNAANPQFGPAVDRQRELVARLESVLRLLQSLDERERLNAEILRIQDLLKDTNRLIARQKDVRAETQRSRQPQHAADAQKKVADEAGKLEEKITEQDKQREQARRPEGKDDKSPKESPEGKQQGEKEGKQPEKQSDKPSEGEGSQTQGDQKPGGSKSQKSEKPSEKSQGQPGESPSEKSPMPPQGQPQQGQSPPKPGQKPDQKPEGSQETPGREQLEQARREMQQAIEQLQQENKDKAIDEQDDAVARLEEMKAQLEEILRQLREDEKESYLTLLEARFQNMFKRQQQVNSETVRLNAIAEGDRASQNYASQTDNIRKEQEDNALEAEKALHLLKEEGSSVAFPEAVDQMHKNMRVVAGRLASQDTGGTTQLVEKLIVETLEELIAAFRKELQKKQEQQQSPPGQQGPPQDPALVDHLAELKLIRSLQNQVNRLTKQIGTELDGKLPSDPAQRELIQDLRARQERIQEATYDLSVGRNQ